MACGTLDRRGGGCSADSSRRLRQHSDNLFLHLSGLCLGQPVTGEQHYVDAAWEQVPMLPYSFTKQAFAAIPDDGVADLARDCKANAAWTVRIGRLREDCD